MKAAVCIRYAASVNPLDGGSMKGRPYIVRIMTGLRKPKITRHGIDVAGQVLPNKRAD